MCTYKVNEVKKMNIILIIIKILKMTERGKKIMNNTMIILNEEIEIKEYNGKRVITTYDIAKLHGRDVKRINELFKNNRNRFIENEDYFIANKNLINWSFKTSSENISSNLKELILFTELGYLLLTKVMNDDRSWGVQRILTKSYFKIQELKNAIESGEIEIKKVNSEIQSNNNQLEQLKSIENIITAYKNAESRPEKLMIIEMVAQMTGNKNKFGYGMADGATSELRKGTVTSQEIAEMMRSRYGLNDSFTQGSVHSLVKYNNLTDETYRYLYYNETTMTNTFRYYPDELIPKLYDLIKDIQSMDYQNLITKLMIWKLKMKIFKTI